MIGLPMRDSIRPPGRLRAFRIAFLTVRTFPTVVRISRLLPRLDGLDKCLGKHATVRLLQGMKCRLVVGKHGGLVTYPDCLRGIARQGILAASVVHGSRSVVQACVGTQKLCFWSEICTDMIKMR